eukprot:3793834-Heterocapsa_arctica.AAC.1
MEAWDFFKIAAPILKDASVPKVEVVERRVPELDDSDSLEWRTLGLLPVGPEAESPQAYPPTLSLPP